MNCLRSVKTLLLALAVAAFGMGAAAVATPAYAAKPAVYLQKNAEAAIGGYDLVSYFQGAGEPVKGSAQFAAIHNGVTYWFASAANRDAFRKTPSRYLPQYGGYCAWAAAEGKLAPGRPQFYRVVDGKLYLNFDRGVQTRWLKDIPGFIAKANANWPGLLEK